MEVSNARFTSEVKLDLNSYLEYLRLYFCTEPRNLAARILIIFLCISRIPILGNDDSSRMFLLFVVVIALIEWNTYRKYRDGGLGYKQMLHQESGIPHNLVSFRQDGILFQNPRTGNETLERYESIQEIRESKHLLVLITDLKLQRVIDKRTLTVGTSAELLVFLREKCPNLKKRVSKDRFGLVVRYLQWSLLVFGAIWSILGLFSIPDRLAGKITNHMPAQQVAEELGQLGIEISPCALDTILLHESSCTSFFARYPGESKVLDMLIYEGMGQYDYDTWDWTPSESGVYWFDTEVMDAGAIYSAFLMGVDAMDENLAFSNITEDYSAVDMESGMGIVTFSFDYQGQTYTLNAQYQYDWFDTNMLFHMGRILNTDSDPKELWYTFDGQGVLLYYGTSKEKLALEDKTGIILLDPVNYPLYG